MNKVYSSSEICDLFGISKSTLFRWEDQGDIPPVKRDINDYRQYTDQHVDAISKLQEKKKMVPQYKRAYEAERKEQLALIHEQLSMRKFLQGDVLGLYELQEYPNLSVDIVRRLMRIALEQYNPKDREFCEIIRAISRQTCKTHPQPEEWGGQDKVPL